MMNCIYNKLLTLFTPIVKLVSYVYISFGKNKISGIHYYKWKDDIIPGTVILTTSYSYPLANIINPVEIKHAGIYVGYILDDGIPYVFEATKYGAVLTDLITFLTSKDVAIGCKPLFTNNSIIKKLHTVAKGYLGVEYDYQFSIGKSKFYCFELAATCLQDIHPEVKLKLTEIISDKLIYNADTFLDINNFEVIFDSRVVK